MLLIQDVRILIALCLLFTPSSNWALMGSGDFGLMNNISQKTENKKLQVASKDMPKTIEAIKNAPKRPEVTVVIEQPKNATKRAGVTVIKDELIKNAPVIKTAPANADMGAFVDIMETLGKPQELNNSKLKFSKTRVGLTTTEYAHEDYNQAIKTLRKNDINGAMLQLAKILEKQPKFHLARLNLVELQRQQNNIVAAETILTDGLRIEKDNADYITQRAELYIAKQEYPAAVELLLTMPVEKQQEISYQELLAVAYYQQELYATAKKIYVTLLNSHQPQSSWLLGLAICHDALGEYQKALANFAQARETGYFEGEVINYIEQRIAAIKLYDKSADKNNKQLARNK